jgi:hypothetical protein
MGRHCLRMIHPSLALRLCSDRGGINEAAGDVIVVIRLRRDSGLRDGEIKLARET